MPRTNAPKPKSKRPVGDHGPDAKWRKTRAEREDRDERRAAQHERAAKQGQKAAQFNLGVMFEDSIGVPKDLVQAYLYYALAVNGGPPYAARNLSQIRGDMTPEQIAKAEQLKANRKRLEDEKAKADEVRFISLAQ